MNYIEFNQRILSHYTENSFSALSSFSIDITEFENLVDLQELRTWPELKSWNELLKEIDGIPQYLGLIAVQCYAAALMHDDGDHSANAYQIRLRELLGIRDNNELQSLFRGSRSHKPVQEQIWMHARRFMSLKFGWNLQLPKINTHRGRYVQFPKSQSLLHLEDLRAFTKFFNQEFRCGEIVSYDFFKERLQARLINIEMGNGCKQAFGDPDKGEQCCRQVYNFFNAWDGKVFEKRPGMRVTQHTTAAGAAREKKLVLSLEEDKPEFFWQEKSHLIKVEPQDIAREKNYKIFHSDIWLFNEMEYYFNEYEDARFLLNSSTACVLVNAHRRPLQDQSLRKICSASFSINAALTLYKFNTTNISRNAALSKYLIRNNPARLSAGLKLDRSSHYLYGFGPVIECPQKYVVLHDNEICTYEPSTAQPGQYKVRTDYYPDIRFDIRTIPDTATDTTPLGLGWDLTAYRHGKENQLEGLLLKPFNRPVDQPDIRSWIQVNLGKKYVGKIPLLKIISQAKARP